MEGMENVTIRIFAVGQLAPSPFWPSNVTDGAMLHQDPEGGVCVVIYIDDPTPEDIEELSSPIAARYLLGDNGCGLWLLGFGDRPFIFELPQDPTTYPADQTEVRLASWERNNLWQIVIIDSSTGLIARNIRAAAAPEEFLRVLSKAMNQAMQTPDFSDLYQKYRNRWERESLEDLWSRAISVGSFGKDLVIEKDTEE